MQIEEKKLGNLLVVTILDKRLDASVAYEFKSQMETFISRGDRLILLDISQVDFIDSSGLGAIVSSLKRLSGRGDILISGAREAVMRLFKLTRMNKVFRMFESENDAIAALS